VTLQRKLYSRILLVGKKMYSIHIFADFADFPRAQLARNKVIQYFFPSNSCSEITCQEKQIIREENVIILLM
jgi:hypothetical protein